MHAPNRPRDEEKGILTIGKGRRGQPTHPVDPSHCGALTIAKGRRGQPTHPVDPSYCGAPSHKCVQVGFFGSGLVAPLGCAVASGSPDWSLFRGLGPIL
eukprot:360770-Chlamydomonas_euryale.AAC.9